MNKIPCEIVRDLLPSYVDQLTNETTNQYMEEHLADCTPCRELYETMKAPEPDVLQTTAADGAAGETGEKKEIDFLKKNRRRNKWVILGCIAALVVILAVLFITRYMIGNYVYDTTGDIYMWDVQVDGDHLSLTGRSVNDIFKITGVSFHEESYPGGEFILVGEARHVPSGFVASIIYGKEFHTEYTASNPIKQIWINDRIIWNEGEEVSTLASCIFKIRHMYIGDMPVNNMMANCLNIANYLGPYLNELHTAERPYGWTFALANDIPSNRLAIREADMEAFSYVLLAAIENLDEVTFAYTVDGKAAEKVITTDDATAFFGQDIKNCYSDVNLLDELIRETGLDHYVLGGSSGYVFDSNTVTDGQGRDITDTNDLAAINVVNNSDTDILAISVGVYIDGELVETESSLRDDGSFLKKGELVQFFLKPAALVAAMESDLELEFKSTLELEFSIYTAEDTCYKIPEKLRFPGVTGFFHDIHITGNAEDGFTVTQ